MSKKTYQEAMESALQSEMDARDDLLVFRVGAADEPEETEREILLPNMGTTAFSVALGAAMTGMHPVLDLRQQPAHGMLLLDALCELPAGKPPKMTVITNTEDLELLTDLPGILSLCPKTPRQAAGFMRAALRSDKLSLLMADEALYEETDEVPEDGDFVMLPLDGWNGLENEEETPGQAGAETVSADVGEKDAVEFVPEAEGIMETPDETAQESASEEIACDDPDAEPEEETGDGLMAADAQEGSQKQATVAVQAAFCAARALPCALNKLYELSGELAMQPEAMISRCMAHVGRRAPGFEWRYEAEAAEGECAFLPPKNANASVWLGKDRLTVAYDEEKLAHEEAASLLRAIRRVLEKPVLLIYDREDEEQ